MPCSLELKLGEPLKVDDGGGDGDRGPAYRTCLLSSKPAAFEEVRPLKSQNMISASNLSWRIARTTRFTFCFKAGLISKHGNKQSCLHRLLKSPWMFQKC